jgi:hypothetical protein
MSNSLCIDLTAKIDGSGAKYYIGKLQAPVTIEAHDGIAFLIFTSLEGQEQLQIAPIEYRKPGMDK